MKEEHEKLIRETAKDLAKDVPTPVDVIHRLLVAIYETGRMVGVSEGVDTARAMVANMKR